MSKNYKPGTEIKTIAGLDKALSENRLIFVKNWRKVTHPIILANMQYRVVKGFIESRQLFMAEKINQKEE